LYHVSSGTLYHVALFRTDVLEIVLPLSSGVLKLIGDGDSLFFEMSVRTSDTWYKAPEDIINRYHDESMPEDSVLRILIV
jgi:hypothetical protein